MGRSRDGESPYCKWVRTTEADYEILAEIAVARGLVSRDGTKKPSTAKALEDLLEIAYRCIASHGAEFAKPAQHPQARKDFKALARKVGIKRPTKRRRGERGKDKAPRRRRSK